MSVELESAKRLTALKNRIDAKTEKTSNTLSESIDNVIAGYGQGGGSSVDTSIEDAILDGSLSGTYTNDRITTIRGHAFRETKLEIFNSESLTNISPYGFYGASTIKECNIPNVIEIGANAFYGCSSLKRLELPNINTGIPQSAFPNCTSLEYINIGKTPSLANGVFNGCKSLKALVILKDDGIASLNFANTLNPSTVGSVIITYVPDIWLDTYKNATNWATYADQIKPLSELPEEFKQ